jgi:hypothetical protein
MNSNSHCRTRYGAGIIGQKTFLEIQLIWLGHDLILTITGGKAHIGSLCYATGQPDHNLRHFTFPGHREDKIVLETFKKLSGKLKGKLLVVGGIHYDSITRDQIAEINSNCVQLIDRICQDLEEL